MSKILKAVFSDVEIHHLETPHTLRFDTISIAEKGPIRASLVGKLNYGNSTIRVTVSLPFSSTYFGSRISLDFLGCHYRYGVMQYQ